MKKSMDKLDKVVGIFTTGFAFIAAAALLFIVFIIIANVVGRWFGRAIIGTDEYVAMAQITTIFLALGYTQHTGGLVHVAFFMKKLPKLCPVIAWALHAWIGTGIVGILLWQTLVRIPTVRVLSTALLIPYKPFYGVLAVGCFVYLVAQLLVAIKSTVAIFDAEVRKEIVENLPA